MEWWSHFLDLLTHNDYFRAGFIWGLVFVAIGWGLWGLIYRLHVQWLKMRQFFEPTRVPGKVPVATGPSPASVMLGCLGRIVVTLVVLATVIVLLLWFVNPPGG
jgi:hypothetical protein